MSWGDIFFWPFDAGFLVIKLVVGLILFAFLIWMIIDCAQRKFKVGAEKWVWIILMIVFTWIAAAVYYIFVRSLNPKGVAKK